MLVFVLSTCDTSEIITKVCAFPEFRLFCYSFKQPTAKGRKLGFLSNSKDNSERKLHAHI